MRSEGDKKKKSLLKKKARFRFYSKGNKMKVCQMILFVCLFVFSPGCTLFSPFILLSCILSYPYWYLKFLLGRRLRALFFFFFFYTWLKTIRIVIIQGKEAQWYIHLKELVAFFSKIIFDGWKVSCVFKQEN